MKRKQKSKKKQFLAIFALLALSIVVTVGVVLAHGGSTPRDEQARTGQAESSGIMGSGMMAEGLGPGMTSGGMKPGAMLNSMMGMMNHMMMGMTGDMDKMHEQMENVLESGDFKSLEELRDKWNMPIMHWVENEKDMQLTKQMHDRFEGTGLAGKGLGMGCHG